MKDRFNHSQIMVDLETLDTSPTAIVLSIGAVRMDFLTGLVSDEFYRVIDVDSCKAIGLTESKSTRDWWNRQSGEARRVFTDPNVPILEALSDFASYVRRFGAQNVKVWGCGSDFDNVILINAYKQLDSLPPWRFWNNRCYRTVRELFADKIPQELLERSGVYHNALDDAKHQAAILLSLREYIGYE